MAGPTHEAPAVNLYIPKFGRVVLIDPAHPLAQTAIPTPAPSRPSHANTERPAPADPLTGNAILRDAASAATERTTQDTHETKQGESKASRSRRRAGREAPV